MGMPPFRQQQQITTKRQEISDATASEDTNIKPFILLAAVLCIACLLFLHILERRRRRVAAAELSPTPLPKGSLDRFVPKQRYRKWLRVRRQTAEENTETPWTEPIWYVPSVDQLKKFADFGFSAICLEVVHGRDMVRILGCSHVFHSACLERWYSGRHHLCPLCRACFIRSRLLGI